MTNSLSQRYLTNMTAEIYKQFDIMIIPKSGKESCGNKINIVFMP